VRALGVERRRRALHPRASGWPESVQGDLEIRGVVRHGSKGDSIISPKQLHPVFSSPNARPRTPGARSSAVRSGRPAERTSAPSRTRLPSVAERCRCAQRTPLALRFALSSPPAAVAQWFPECPCGAEAQVSALCAARGGGAGHVGCDARALTRYARARVARAAEAGVRSYDAQQPTLGEGNPPAPHGQQPHLTHMHMPDTQTV
jgi:hypothetical protein